MVRNEKHHSSTKNDQHHLAQSHGLVIVWNGRWFVTEGDLLLKQENPSKLIQNSNDSCLIGVWKTAKQLPELALETTARADALMPVVAWIAVLRLFH